MRQFPLSLRLYCLLLVLPALVVLLSRSRSCSLPVLCSLMIPLLVLLGPEAMRLPVPMKCPKACHSCQIRSTSRCDCQPAAGPAKKGVGHREGP